MKRTRISTASIGLVALWIIAPPVARAGADGPKPAAVAAPAMPPDLVRRIEEITDAVLEHHIDPPARQQMILSGIKALYRAGGRPAPPDLARRASSVATPDQLASLLNESWPRTTPRPLSAEKLERIALEGTLAAVPGSAELMTTKERNANEQIAGNRYVGILVSLARDEKERRPRFHQVMSGGPAEEAGIKAGELLEAIDGVDTRDMDLRDVVERTRGDEGTIVTIKVRDPKAAKSRTVRLTRSPLPPGRLMNTTVHGLRDKPLGGRVLRLDGPDPVGYARIGAIAASTPHELRKMARQMESEGLRALVLDLRGLGASRMAAEATVVHSAVLVADSLLESGPIGRIRTTRGETTYQADPDALFRGWPIAAIVDQGTSGIGEWIAAALQDNHRAVIVGWPTASAHRRAAAPGLLMMEREASTGGEAVVSSTVPVGDGRWWVSLATGHLERGDGRPVAHPTPAGPVGWIAGATSRGGVLPDRQLPDSSPRSLPGREPGGGPDAPRRADDRTYAIARPDETPRTSSTDPAIEAAAKALRGAMESR